MRIKEAHIDVPKKFGQENCMIKKAVITGPTGAIGMALLEYLITQEIEVLAIVRPDSGRKHRLDRFAGRFLRIAECSIDDYAAIRSEEYGSDYDILFHFAWEATIGDGRNDLYLQNKNVKYTLDAVHLANRLGCHTFIGAGSQAEYGRVQEKITSDTPVHPDNGYGMAKLCAGMMSRVECRKLQMKHVWVRILSVYGPYDGERTMMISGIRAMLKGERPSFSKGEQLWDYLYSKDAARAVFLAGERGRNGAVYPVGSGIVRPLYEYIERMRDTVSRISGKAAAAGIGDLPYREQQVMYLCADIKELTADTGFVPEISFEEGIEHTVRWCEAGLL